MAVALSPSCSREGSASLACIVLSSKVKKPAKKQPSELSRKPNQKEKRGRAEEKPRNKSASPLPPSALSSSGDRAVPLLLPSPPWLTPRGGHGAPVELPLGQQHPWRGWALNLPSCFLELKGLEEVLGGTRLSFPGVFCLVGEDPWGTALGLCLSAIPRSWGMGELLSQGSCLPASWEMCVKAWVECGRALLPGSLCRAGRRDALTCVIALFVSPVVSRGFHLNYLTSFLFLPQTFESGTRPEEI